MPAAVVPAIGMGISAIGGALGKKKTQQQQESTETRDLLTEIVEDSRYSEGRASLLPRIQQEFQKINKPIYGDGAKAGVLNNLNSLTNSAIESLKGSMGRAGGLDSGRFFSETSDLNLERFNKAADFFSSLPAREEEARRGSFNDLFGLTSNFFGRAPVSEKQTGTIKKKGSGTTTESGPGIASSLLSGFGQDLYQGGRASRGLGKVFGF